MYPPRTHTPFRLLSGISQGLARTRVAGPLGLGDPPAARKSLREKRGLVYSISAGLSGFMDTGSLSIYAATAKERVDIVLSLIGDEVKKLVDEAVPTDELQRAKDNLKGG